MQKQELQVSKTARYFTLGELNKTTKKIWFVLHGYAQTADDFLDSLNGLLEKDSFIIAPEGLSRFYWKDFTNHPVASWMTKTDRGVDIVDNIKYLNELYHSILIDYDLKEVEINYIGFSQGAATLSRWIYHDRVKVDQVFFYAGDLAKEIDYSLSKNYRNAILHYIYGCKDFFIKSSRVVELKNQFLGKNLNLNIFTFEGKHKIVDEAVEFILKQQTK